MWAPSTLRKIVPAFPTTTVVLASADETLVRVDEVPLT
jgi:hypothetical protein